MKPVRVRSRAMVRALWVFVLSSFVLVAIAGYGALNVYRYPDVVSGTATGEVSFTIPRGANARRVAEALADAGLLDNPTWFRLYAGQRGVASRFRAGVYTIEAPITPRGLIDNLIRGATETLVSVTIAEGKNLVEIADLFAEGQVVDREEFLKLAVDSAFADELALPGLSVEGYLFPDTYRFRRQSSARGVLIELVRRHREVYEELRDKYGDSLDEIKAKLDWSDKDIVIMASIVEKETGQAHERPRIAQVFINRLLFPTFNPKLLQTDPTISYGCTVGPLILGETSDACSKFEGRIRRIHLLDKENPYSTYAHTGLPPGPISNPGREALRAVMQPDGSKFLYFVSRNDGTHKFSETKAEHDAAVVKFQRGGQPLDTQ